MNTLTMRSIPIVLTMAVSLSAFAQEIEYSPIEPETQGQLSLRDTWDRTKQFCYLTEAKEKLCLNISAMGEIKIRENGDWSTNPTDLDYINQLPEDLRRDAMSYHRLFVRYLALGDGNRFLVHIFFFKNGGTETSSETIFAFGNYQVVNGETKAQLTSMSYSNGLEVLGGLLAAAASVAEKDRNDQTALYSAIVRMNTPLLRIGARAVETYLNSRPQGASPERLP